MESGEKFRTILKKETSRPPLILAWTGLWGGNWSEDWSKCHVECDFSDDRDLIQKADAILAHSRDINPKDPPPTSERLKGRVVGFNLEAPPHMDSGQNLDELGPIFDWTMTYHSAADITFRYGWLERRLLSPEAWANESARLDRLIAGKTKIAVWMVSNCNTDSRRENYIEKLREHLPGLVQLGACNERPCDKANGDCESKLAAEFKFYFAFENAVCDEYVTEKFFRRLQNGLVPVVLNRDSIAKLIPPEVSYIAADDFDSPKELASYLKNLASDEKAYRRLFDWRKRYDVKNMLYSWDILCTLCQRLHVEKASWRPQRLLQSLRRRIDLKEWSWRHGRCKHAFAASLATFISSTLPSKANETTGNGDEPLTLSSTPNVWQTTDV